MNLEETIDFIIETTGPVNGIRVSPRLPTVERINTYIGRLFEKYGIPHSQTAVEMARNEIIADVYGAGRRLSPRFVGHAVEKIE